MNFRRVKSGRRNKVRKTQQFEPRSFSIGSAVIRSRAVVGSKDLDEWSSSLSGALKEFYASADQSVDPLVYERSQASKNTWHKCKHVPDFST